MIAMANFRCASEEVPSLETLPRQKCGSHDKCSDCLSSDCVWAIGRCMDDCLVSDVACYASEYFGEMTPQQICKVEENRNLDSEVCGNQTSCADCTSTVLPSDETANCMWFENERGGYCQARCGMMGCGVYECPRAGRDEGVTVTINAPTEKPTEKELNPLCKLEPETGPCRAAFRQYYYNYSTGKCEIFTYGGCQGKFLKKKKTEARVVAW